MARRFAPIYTAIWQDQQFRQLTAGAQRWYLLLVSQPDITAAGTLPLTVRRWASMAADTEPKQAGKELRELVDTDYVVADTDTEELLVRSFIRWDAAYGNPRRRPAILKAAGAVGSAHIRAALAVEFKRVGLPTDVLGQVDSHSVRQSDSQSDPMTATEAKPQVNSHSDRQSDSHTGSQPDSHGFLVPVVSTSEVVSTQGCRAPTESTPKPKTSSRGSRIPEDFAITDAMRAWAEQHTPTVDPDAETDRFRDHWRAASGKGATKLDWVAAWRNWLRKAVEYAPRHLRAVGAYEAWRNPTNHDVYDEDL